MQDIKELKAYLDKQVVRDILESLGYEFNRTGQFKLRDERTPSASIRRDGLIKDFGSDWSGDIFALLQEYHSMTFKEAVDYVANYLGLSSVDVEVKKAPRFTPKPKEEPKPSYDITKIYERFKSQKESLGVKILDQFHNDLIPKSILAQIEHSSLKKMIGYDTRNESFTISLLKGDEVKAVTIQRTKDGTKWKTYGKKSYIPYRITLKPYVFVVFGMKEILIMESWKEPYIGFQSDSVAKGIANSPQGAEIKEAVADRTLILLLDNDTSCFETIEPISAYFSNSAVIVIDFQKLLFDQELPKGYDFYDFVMWCESLKVAELMLNDFITGYPFYDVGADVIPVLAEVA